MISYFSKKKFIKYFLEQMNKNNVELFFKNNNIEKYKYQNKNNILFFSKQIFYDFCFYIYNNNKENLKFIKNDIDFNNLFNSTFNKFFEYEIN